MPVMLARQQSTMASMTSLYSASCGTVYKVPLLSWIHLYYKGSQGNAMNARLQQILDRPEDRARYSLQFYYSFMDPKMNEKALNRFQEFLDVIEHNVEPYELY